MEGTVILPSPARTSSDAADHSQAATDRLPKYSGIRVDGTHVQVGWLIWTYLSETSWGRLGCQCHRTSETTVLWLGNAPWAHEPLFLSEVIAWLAIVDCWVLSSGALSCGGPQTEKTRDF